MFIQVPSVRHNFNNCLININEIQFIAQKGETECIICFYNREIVVPYSYQELIEKLTEKNLNIKYV